MTKSNSVIETWADIKEYETLYQISDAGRVKSLQRPDKWGGISYKKIILKPGFKKGYHSVVLYKDSVPTHITIHRLVANTFLPIQKEKDFVNHINGIKTDNRLENLEWCTSKENMAHALNTGLRKGVRGEKSHLSKITKDDVIKIRELRSSGIELKEIANNFNITFQQVSRIANKTSWKHV